MQTSREYPWGQRNGDTISFGPRALKIKYDVRCLPPTRSTGQRSGIYIKTVFHGGDDGEGAGSFGYGLG